MTQLAVAEALPAAHDIEAPHCSCCRTPLHGADADRTTCGWCQDRIHDRLNTIEHLWLKLADRLGRDSVNGPVVTTSRTAGIPLRLDTLNLIGPGGIVTVLQCREDEWRKARGMTATPWRGNLDQTLPGVVRFLRLNLPWACQHYPDVDDLDNDLAQLVSAATSIVTGERKRFIAVNCIAVLDDWGTVCGQQLLLNVHASSSRCWSCNTRYSRDDWVSLYEAA